MASMCTRSWMRMGGLLIPVVLLFSAASLTSAAPSNVAAWRRNGPNTNNLGYSVGTTGDFNCDGISDLAIGAPLASSLPNGTPVASHQGWIGVWYGDSTLPPQPSEPPDWFVTGNGSATQTEAQLGWLVAADDVNGDGCDDVVLGQRANPGASANVRAYFGSVSGPDTNFDWRRTIANFGATFAFGTSGVGDLATGDVNGDGYADIIVGIPDAGFGQAEEGALFVWLGGPNLANILDGPADPEWIAQSDQAGAKLGHSVASEGDVNRDGRDDIVAGAPQWDGISANTGIVLMWRGSATLASDLDGTPANAAWSLQIGTPAAELGSSVAIAGDVDGDGYADIVSGAPFYDNPFTVGTAEGTVLVTRGASPAPGVNVFDWTHFGLNKGWLGWDVASAGDVNGDGLADYLMGEPRDNSDATLHGRAHLLLGRPTSAWGPNPATDVVYAEVGLPGTPHAESYGVAVGTAGDWNNDGFSDIVVGSPGIDVTGAGFSMDGVAFVYLGRGETLAAAPVYTIRSFQPSAVLGLNVAFAGDINHDGYTDIVSGSPNHESQVAQTDEGRVFINYGGSCGPACVPLELVLPDDREGNQAGANLGWSVSGAGDVNGDGYADVIAGAPTFDGSFFPCPIGQNCPVPDAGRAQVFLGGSGGLAFSAGWTVTGGSSNSKLGWSVAGAGDVNGDGFGDVIVGVPLQDVGQSDTGRALLYLGSASGLATSPSWVKNGTLANAQFGIDVAGAGDVNGDGFSDVIIGAPGHGAAGAAFIYLGRPTTPSFPQGLSDTPIRTLVGIQESSQFAITVASAGDVNRDGFADVVVGAPEFDEDPGFGPQVGMASVYHGAAAGPSSTSATNLFGEPFEGGRMGNGVAGAGDVNGDGFGDLIVGDHWNSGTQGFAQGEAYIFHGSASGIVPTPVRTFQDCPHSICDFAHTVAGAGDVNGDGFSDVLIAAYRLSDVAVDAGGVFVHLGNDGRGTPVKPLQSLGFGLGPLALLGSVTSWFDAGLELKSPAGRSRVQLELEVKPLGQNFDGLNTIKSNRFDNILVRADLSFLGSPGGVYQWRARLKSASPIFGRLRWISLPENASREMDVRVLPEPGLAAALFAGIGTLAGLERRRRRFSGVGSDCGE